MKKTAIALAITIGFASMASEYLVIIKKDKNKYDVIENSSWVNIDPLYTEWTETGIINNCGTWSPNISTKKLDFSQSTNCEIEKERTKTYREQSLIDSTIRITNQDVEKSFINETLSRNISVTSALPLIEKTNYNCSSWIPNTDSYYYDKPLNQNRTCDVDKMTEWSYTLDTSNIGKWEERYTEKTGTENQNVVGTHLENSCNDILNNGHSIGDGNYTISLPTGNEYVLCDMTSDDGGWTLLMSTGSDTGRPQMTSTNINKNSPPANSDYSNYDYFPKMNDFISQFDSNTNIKFSCQDYSNNQIKNYFHKNITNFDTYFNLDKGSYTGTITCATDNNFTQNTSSLVTSCIGGNNEFHRYYRGNVNEYGWANYNGADLPKMLRHCGAAWYGSNTSSHNGYIWFK